MKKFVVAVIAVFAALVIGGGAFYYYETVVNEEKYIEYLVINAKYDKALKKMDKDQNLAYGAMVDYIEICRARDELIANYECNSPEKSFSSATRLVNALENFVPSWDTLLPPKLCEQYNVYMNTYDQILDYSLAIADLTEKSQRVYLNDVFLNKQKSVSRLTLVMNLKDSKEAFEELKETYIDEEICYEDDYSCVSYKCGIFTEYIESILDSFAEAVETEIADAQATVDYCLEQGFTTVYLNDRVESYDAYIISELREIADESDIEANAAYIYNHLETSMLAYYMHTRTLYYR